MSLNNNNHVIQGVKNRGKDKLSRIPIKIIQPQQIIKKPPWIRVKLSTSKTFNQVVKLIKEHNLHTVCEEASCPNIGECFSSGTATFMIMGDICTRRCTFCDIGHGKPNPLNKNEPIELAKSVKILQLKYVVITSVDRDDLLDGGANHFVNCIDEIRIINPRVKIEILVPDFRGRIEKALMAFDTTYPDVFNHNLETVPRLYKQVRPGADYHHSLKLLKQFKELHKNIPTKSGIMLGLGESDEEIKEVMLDMRKNNIDIITIGQYLQPSKYHFPVLRYITPEQFDIFRDFAYEIGFKHAAVGALIRSSYHAEKHIDFNIKENG